MHSDGGTNVTKAKDDEDAAWLVFVTVTRVGGLERTGPVRTAEA